ncbi:deoxyribodipyrimidine photo-lyase [Streptacidiphilus sp. P02-A3a]|uniref:cryptochrome/photolyase family protein n=1 Tax=Streptacidiphilus sp. P02-A3a TaxID=2704468 RepID=UPI0015F78B64|nr:deoxyribodipyrimidine photo-lyase [Streptacidiphilus sp. P02-A3a]QMU69536.1 deoxyribodipyrimidine photo-lyase [Streptacidiphilus sp. P02-A3a]
MPDGVSIALLTCDLRVHDNPVLHAAARDTATVPLFVLDDAVREAGFVPPNRAAFLADCLEDLDRSLRDRGGSLLVLAGDAVEQTARLADALGAARVHLAEGVSGFAQHREQRLRALLGPRLTIHQAVATTVAPGALLPGGRDHYAVFGAYHRRWLLAERRAPLPVPRKLTVPQLPWPGLEQAEVRARLAAAGRPAPGLLPGGESQGRRRLRSWVGSNAVAAYPELQDDLAADGTSRLSPYLHFGCVSATEAAHRATKEGSPGAEAFLRQLAWRDFHHQLLAARPDCARADYRPRQDHWRSAPAELEAWRAGRTGYPLVDAGMRQLLHEGWMHNRARMITASFLSKTLYLDWRAGAEHFLRHLVDGDVANNQLNWQWVAGTGTDTRPNRVLNPLRQADRFDPRGDYVRRWVPELAAVAGPAVHRPWELDAAERARLDYPEPLVALDAALTRFRLARGL